MTASCPGLTRASMMTCHFHKPYGFLLLQFIMDCRVIGVRKHAVLRTAMPGNDSGEVVQKLPPRSPLEPVPAQAGAGMSGSGRTCMVARCRTKQSQL